MAIVNSMIRGEAYSPDVLKAEMHSWIKEFFGIDEDLSKLALLEDVLRREGIAFLVNNEEDGGYAFSNPRMAGEEEYVGIALEKQEFLSQFGYHGTFVKDKDAKIAGFSFQRRESRQAA